VADLETRAATSAPTEGRPLYAGLRALAVPDEPVARLWHAATLLREHRGDSHNAVLQSNGIGGSEAHVLLALSWGMAPEKFDRLHHLPRAQVAAVVDRLRVRGLVDAAGGFTAAGREIKERVEAITDTLAAAAYDVLSEDELDTLIAGLETLNATRSEAAPAPPVVRMMRREVSPEDGPSPTRSSPSRCRRCRPTTSIRPAGTSGAPTHTCR
jgi:hypothetical protein